MTSREWNMGIEFLMSAEEGDWLAEADRRVEVVNMCGGRFLCLDAEGVVILTDAVSRAMSFLRGI